MSWTWENWSSGRPVVHRNSKGQFAKSNFHMPEKWKENILKSHTEEHREKLSKVFTGRVLTKEHKEKISKALKGIKKGPVSKQHKINLSKALQGRKLSKSHKENISIGRIRKFKKMKEVEN